MEHTKYMQAKTYLLVSNDFKKNIRQSNSECDLSAKKQFHPCLLILSFREHI
jgi:hypothetical protein